MKGLLRYFITRILLTVPMVFILLTIVFVVLRVMPGDPVSAMLGAHAPQTVIDQKRAELGLDKPISLQYLSYLGQIARLDLGNSMVLQQSVAGAIGDKLPETIELTIFGMLFTLLIGVPLGAYAARNRRTGRDFAIRLFGNVAYCIPVYWMGLMLQLVFGVWLHWLPVAGRTSARVIPSLFEKTGFYVLDTILSAPARGIPDRWVTYRHGLKNAFVPILTMLGLEFAMLLSGAILTETTFSWPGMGRLLLERIYLRDYPVVQGVIVVFALMVSAISLIVDLFYSVIDPRVRY